MKLIERKKTILIHIAWILALAVILWPLFTIAKYDYPSADDWSFGKYMYRAVQAGEGIAGVFHAIYQTLAQNVWEARFSILILSALQPAAFGEHFYRITPYLMIGSVILSQFLLLRECIAGQAKENRWQILQIGIPWQFSRFFTASILRKAFICITVRLISLLCIACHWSC